MDSDANAQRWGSRRDRSFLKATQRTAQGPDVESSASDQVIHFNLYSTLGMIFSIAIPPITIGLSLAVVVGVGGFPYFIWGFLFAGSFQLIQMLAQAELASAMPHSSGPAHWVQHLAPQATRKFFGHLIGWLTVALLWFGLVANLLFLAQVCLGTAEALNPGYKPPAWHFYLVYCAFSVAVFVNNVPGPFKILPPMLAASTFVINGAALYLVIALLVRATPKSTAHAVFVQVVNETGWSSDGVVFFLALLPGLLVVNWFDTITHITDEVENPTKQVPQVMIAFGCLSFITGFGMAIALGFSTTSPQNLLDPYGHQPLIQLVFDASRSKAIATAGAILVICSLYFATVAAFTSWNRLCWSFSRNGTLPLSGYMSKLSSADRLPVNAMIVNVLLILGLGSIQLGSALAISAVAAGAAICMTVTYSTIFGFALWRGRGYLEQKRWLNLGRFGSPIYICGFVWNVFMTVWLSFPMYTPVTLAYMNWASLVFGGVAVMAVVYWMMIRRTNLLTGLASE